MACIMMGLGYPEGKDTLDNAAGSSGLSTTVLKHFKCLQCNVCKRREPSEVEIQQRELNQNQPLPMNQEMMDRATYKGLAGAAPHSARGV